MKFFFKFFKLSNLYSYFLVLALLNIFFSTASANSKIFTIDDIEISTPFEINFDKNQIIEIQGTAEDAPFSKTELSDMLELGSSAINEIIERQKACIE